MLLHLRSVRRFVHSGGWICTLLEEVENERMHLVTFMEVAKPHWYERALVLVVHVFFNAYFLDYLLSPKFAHRVVGYLEEETIAIAEVGVVEERQVGEGEEGQVSGPRHTGTTWGHRRRGCTAYLFPSSLDPEILEGLLGSVGGVMAFLTLHEMLPLAFDYAGQKQAVKAVFVGMAFMSASLYFLEISLPKEMSL